MDDEKMMREALRSMSRTLGRRSDFFWLARTLAGTRFQRSFECVRDHGSRWSTVNVFVRRPPVQTQRVSWVRMPSK